MTKRLLLSPRINGRAAVLWASVVLVVLVMPSHRSLWSDEASTATLASASTFHGWYVQMREGVRSEHQMPLGMLSAWASGRVLGTSEWALRAPNIVWAFVALIGLFFAGKVITKPWLPLLLFVQPFFWYYMDEARPYAMQIAAGAWLAFVLVDLVVGHASGAKWAIALAVAGVVLCGSSLLGVIPFCCCCLVLCYPLLTREWRISRAAVVWLGGSAVVLFALAVFYVWTLEKGAGGTRVWPVSFSNAGFALYELAGFMGLGPSRIALRDAASESATAALQTMLPYAIVLALLFGLYVYLLVNWLRTDVPKQQRRIVFACSAVCVSTVGLMLILAYAVRWPFWGRHLAAILPFQVLIVASWIAAAKSASARIAATALCGLLVASALELRFGAAHLRDDYRTAAKAARDAVASGKTVWWCADAEAAAYYQVRLSSASTAGAAIPVENRTADQLRVLAEEAPPQFIIYTRANACDQFHAVGDFVRQNGWVVAGTAPAFTFYKKLP